MITESHRRQRRAGYVVGAFVPFPRSTWIHPHVPRDDFDRVCKVIWARAKKCEERFGRGRGAAGNRADEQQRSANDSSENAQREEGRQQLYRADVALPCPYLSGRRRPRAAESAREPSPVMEEKMELSQEETERRGDADKGEQQHWKIWAPESRSQSINYYDPCGETSESVDEQTKSKSSEETGSSHTLFPKKDFPPLSTEKRGLLPLPTGPPASGKLPGQWETPLPFHPRSIPAAALASGPAAPARAPVQGGAEAPRAASTATAPPAARAQPYDLLADFPALQPPTRPLALGERHGGSPKSRDATGKGEIIHQPNGRQESEAGNESRVRNVPHEVSSICVRDQRSELNPRTCGSQSISCKVAGADGAGVNARSWACAAKAGMKQAAAPQERARPCSFQQIVTINRAKAVNHNTTNKVTQSSIARQPRAQGVGPLEAGSHRGPGSSDLVTLRSQRLQQCFSRRQRLLPFSVSLNHRQTKGEEFLA